jgi:hypothetical protein
VGCDPSLSSIPTGQQRLFSDALAEVAAWADRPENQDEVLLIFLDTDHSLTKWNLLNKLLDTVAEEMGGLGHAFTRSDKARFAAAGGGTGPLGKGPESDPAATTSSSPSSSSSSSSSSKFEAESKEKRPPPPWPTLQQMRDAGKRYLFIGSMDLGLDFLHPRGTLCGWFEAQVTRLYRDKHWDREVDCE